MKTFFTLLFVTLYMSVFSLNWMPFGPTGIHANNILFGAGIHYYSVVCTNDGVCVNNGPGYTWKMYNYSLPVWEAIPYDNEDVLLVMGNGSYSDGIYKFNLTTNTFSVVKWCLIPTFIKFCPVNSTYYVGTRYNGLLSSSDGLQWDTVPYFQNKGCTALDFFGQHIVVAQENNVFATFYSDDSGSTWAQSASNMPIHDLAFDMNGILYGVFTGISNSSGLYLSHDYGQTWQMEYFTDNMNVVGFDVTGSLFTGFHDALPPCEGVAVYDTASNNFCFLNNGLPDKNINRFKINPIMSSIAIFVCTDSGVYFCNDYLTSIQKHFQETDNLIIYPNPAKELIQIETLINTTIEILNSQGQIIEKLSATEPKTIVDVSELSAGVYFIKAIPDKVMDVKNGVIIRKFIKL